MWKVHIVNTCWTYLFSKMSCPQAPSISCLELGSFALEQNARMFFVRFLLILMLLVLNQRSCAYIFILYINCVAKNEVTRFLATPKQMAPQGRHLSDGMEAIAKWASWFNGKKPREADNHSYKFSEEHLSLNGRDSSRLQSFLWIAEKAPSASGRYQTWRESSSQRHEPYRL